MGDSGVVSAPESADETPIEDKTKKKDAVSVLRFNQDGTSLVVATQEGFRVFDISTEGEVVMIFDITTIPQVTHIQRLYSSNLVAFVSALDPESLKVFNMRRNDVVCDHKYEGRIRWLSMNRVRIVVATEEKILVHKIRNMDVLHTINNVNGNPKDLFAMATYELRSYLAFPCESQKGQLRIYNLDSNAEKYQIAAHHAPLEMLVFDEQATRLATCSTKGTVIRVFDATSGIKLHEFRRGMWQTTVHCLTFSRNGEFLGCTSENETIHLFKVMTNLQRTAWEESQGWLSSVGNLATAATGLISSEVERYIKEERAIVTLHNPYSSIRTQLNVLQISDLNKLYIQVSGMNGFLNGFLLETKDAVWSSELHKAYFLTENIRRKAKLV